MKSNMPNISGKYSDPCILKPPVKPEEYGLKLEVVLKWKDIYIENILYNSCVAGWPILKWTKLLNGGVLNHRHHCIIHVCLNCACCDVNTCS